MNDLRLIDSPLQQRNHEALGVGMYADVLSDFIRNCETPITIGIQGDWGIGKTSMLNMVKENIAPTARSKNKYHVIYFNTWQYSQFQQEQFLGLSILKGIMAEIQNLDSLKELRKDENVKSALKSFGGFVKKLGNQVIEKQTGVNINSALQKDEENELTGLLDNDIVLQIRQMKEEFSNLVKILVPVEKDRLVIMIDDLDRIKPVRALEFLEAIKNFLDVESCVFLIAVDYSVIQSGMIEKLGQTAQELQGKSYFDKIIQVPFTMPSTSYQTDRYIMSLLGWNYAKSKNDTYERVENDRERYFLASCRAKSMNKTDVDYFTNITRLTVGNNPRSIKRTVNYSNLLRMIVQSQWSAKNISGSRREWTISDAMILYPLACMQLAWPEMFFHFSNEPNPSTLSMMQDFEFLQSLKGMDTLFKRVHNPEETLSNMTGFIDELIQLVDKNGDGQICNDEFHPIWQMMVDANMTSAKHRSIQNEWNKLENIITAHFGDKKDVPIVKNVFKLFRDDKSHWNDTRKFDLLSAGKRFFNITWAKKQIGSIASTQAQPIQVYLKVDYDTITNAVSDELKKYLSDVRSIGHYGAGDTQLDIVELSRNDNKISLMNELIDAFKAKNFV